VGDHQQREGVETPVRVAVANDYDLIVAGVAHLLSTFPDDIVVCDRILVGEPVSCGAVDVVLYDTYGRPGSAAEAVRELLALEEVRHVAVFTLDITSELIDDVKAAGANGVISKSLGAESVRDALRQMSCGEVVVVTGDLDAPVLDALDWPGKVDGLSERESQVLVLVAEGLTNKEIAAVLFLSVETVKTHLRQILSKLGLRNRVEATAYVLRSGAFARYQPATPSDAERPAPTS
jgi:DNA-binding NarL/FixJ family response regulator